MRQAAFVYHESQSSHVLREDHPLRPHRLACTYELLRSYGAFDLPGSRLVSPPPATEEEILAVHTPDYLAAVKAFSRGDRPVSPARYNFSQWGDNPIFPGMYEASALAAGASLTAARLVARGEVDVAFNPSGGLHHAGPNFASGFCVFNDPAIAIAHLSASGGQGLRVAYVDIDAHHGDGVQNAFYDTNQVLTISLHESGRYLFPGTGGVTEMGRGRGLGYSVNLPLAPHTGDAVYLWAFQEVVPPLLSAFKPHIVVTQLGVDGYFRDPLAHLALTTEGYCQLFREFRRLCPSSGGPRWVALGGGGYDIEAVARLWTLAYGVMMDQDWPDDIPVDYQERYGVKKLLDTSPPPWDAAVQGEARGFAQESVAEIKRTIFPIHGL
ncbi:MAG: acetoin utilization protein AcuC [Chloroflexi bacterium]|nr:acetoin utilization protein AcuC [Chloroflexota bacterium]